MYKYAGTRVTFLIPHVITAVFFKDYDSFVYLEPYKKSLKLDDIYYEKKIRENFYFSQTLLTLRTFLVKKFRTKTTKYPIENKFNTKSSVTGQQKFDADKAEYWPMKI